MLNEADTCTRHIVPKLREAGWDTGAHSFNEQQFVQFTDGRIIVAGTRARRRPPKRADYLLKYTRDFTIAVEEFADCIKWWRIRKENDRAWKVPAKKILDSGCNLDIKNPSAKEHLEHQPPEKLVEGIVAKEQKILEIMGEIKGLLAEGVK